MQTDTKMISHFNGIIKNELTAINQYFLHSKTLSHWGFAALAKKERAESFDEMNHADKLIDRVLYLGGLPNLQDMGRLTIGEKVKEILDADLKLEEKAIPDLRVAIDYAEETNDYGTVELLSEILVSEEEHHHWLRQQINLYNQMGEHNYLQHITGNESA